MSDKAHWMKPCKPGIPRGRHVLLYVEEKTHKGRIIPGQRNAWVADVADNGWTMGIVGSWESTDQLDTILDSVCLKKGETTLWVLRGWSDLVLSGLVELMDAGIITWRYVSLSGRSCLIKGQWRGRKITISAISNWTGSRWDGWGDCSQDAAVARLMTAIDRDDLETDGHIDKVQYDAVCQLAAIVSTCNALSLPRIPPTAGAAGLLLWRSWLGPHIDVELYSKKSKSKHKQADMVTYVGPIPSRPLQAAAAERHTCYALTTRQLRTGLVQGPLYCMDLRSAYLIGLAMTPLPLIYDATLHRPKLPELIERIQCRTGCALVRIQTQDWTYPARVNGKVTQCRGRYWTWLAGAELVHALCHDHIAECWSAHLWHAQIMDDRERQLLDMIKKACDTHNMPSVCAGWRSVYSALIGRFAGWERVWTDSPAHAGFGRWAQWLQADHTSGVVVPHRSVAGKVQRLRDKIDKRDSVPLLFGCVTGMVRWIMQSLCDIVGYEHVYYIAADSIWLDQAGWQAILRGISQRGLAPDNVKVKSIYDKAWMTGGHVVVTERHGVRELHMPGVSTGATIDADGYVIVEHTDDWDSDGEPRANRGIRRRKHRYTATKIVEKYGYPARVIPPGETVSIPLLGQSLLQELRGDRTVDDA